MADLVTARDAIKICRNANVSLFLWGIGMGKSAIVRQVAEELGVGFVDCCVSDLRGMPDTIEDGPIEFLQPADLPNSGTGILFLELNEATSEVSSGACQLALRRAAGRYRLPDGWSVVYAGNFDNETHAISELDPLVLDHFCHIHITSDKQTSAEWSDWMSEHYPSHSLVIIRVMPSRRSWELAVRCLATSHHGDFSRRTRQEVLAGLWGRDLSIRFLNDPRNYHAARCAFQRLCEAGKS